MRVLGVPWSRALGLSLVCELALWVLLEDSTIGIRCQRVGLWCISELCSYIYIGYVTSSVFAHLGNGFQASNQVYECGPYVIAYNTYFFEYVLEWHMSRLLVRNGIHMSR